MGQSDRWSSVISRDKTGGGTDIQDRDRPGIGLCGEDEEPTVSDDGSGSGLLRPVCCAVALRRLRSATEFGMWNLVCGPRVGTIAGS